MPAGFERRLALVIGNNAYPEAPLKNAVNDAAALASALGEAGFTVQRGDNLTLEGFARTIDTFLSTLGPNDIALFYYAGHGIQIDGLNYLVPVDFSAPDQITAKYRAYPVDQLLERLERKGTRLNMLILDACRNNPFGGRTLGGGLAAMQGARGTLVAFATGPLRTASDNRAGQNGLFTTHLLQAIRTPGLTLGQVFDIVRERVDEASAGRQVPWTSSSVVGSFYFKPPVKKDTPPPPPPDPDPGSLAARLAYATMPTGATEREASSKAVQRLAHDLRIGLVLSAANSGLIWASKGLDITARLSGPPSAGKPTDIPSVRRIAFANLQRVASDSAIGRRYTQQVQKATADEEARFRAASNGQPEGEVQRLKTAAEKVVADLQGRLQQDFQVKLMPVVERLAADAGLDLVFAVGDSGIVWANVQLDVTDALIKRLDQATGHGAERPTPAVPPFRRSAYVNVQKIASQSALGKEATSRIQALTAEKTRALNDKNTAITAAQQRLKDGRPVMTETAISQAERELQRLQRELQRLQEDAQTDVDNLTQDLQAEFQKALNPVLDRLAVDNGVQILMSQDEARIVAADASLDLTGLTIQRLDQAHPGK